MLKDPYTELTRDVLNFQQNPVNGKKLIATISYIVYEYPKNYIGWDEDDVSDFFCMFFPKIQGLIDRFVFTGRPFEAYLASSIRWQIKSFSKKRSNEHAGHAVLRSEYKRMYRSFPVSERGYSDPTKENSFGGVSEPGYHYSPEAAKAFGIGTDGRTADPGVGRRFVFLVLRNAYLADDSLIDHAAQLSGMDPGFLVGCATVLREKIAERKSRYLDMAERRDLLYARIQRLSVLLSRETDRLRRDQINYQIDFARTRYLGHVKALKSAQLHPTHNEIAEVLGVPKGSIDSGLYYIRRDIANLGLN